MRICVTVPSEDHLATAGVRIRYQRIEPWLRAAGHELSLKVIDDVLPKSKAHFDVYVLCKCHDARSIILAAELKARGIHTGADFFDDYYSQEDDSRFVHFRTWLRTIRESLTFTLCSTGPMRDRLRRLVPELPCHIVNDPFDRVDSEDLARKVENKIERARRSNILNIGWFGIGDNPHFPVGLSDLTAFASGLGDFERFGFKPRLSIVTNQRALTPGRLEMLSRLPVPYRLEEWTEDGERQLVAESDVCFLPVNAQPFSVVKSLNRAVTALTGGAQVLSAGYPLYGELGDFIYRNGQSIAEDFKAGRAKLCREALPEFLALMDRLANPDREASALIAFLSGLPSRPRPVDSMPFVAVIHGRYSTGAVHKYAQRLGHLSVPAAIATGDLNYDIRLLKGGGKGETTLQLSQNATARLKAHLKGKVTPIQPPAGKLVAEMPLPEDLAANWDQKEAGPSNSDALFIAQYDKEIGQIEAIVQRHFDVTSVVVSEYASPFWRDGQRRLPAVEGAA